MRGRSKNNLAQGFLWLEYGFVSIAQGILSIFDWTLYNFQTLINGGQIPEQYDIRKKKQDKTDL